MKDVKGIATASACALAVCFVVALGGNANAQKPMDLRGAGTTSCAEYAKQYRHYRDQAEWIFLAWAEGYISGTNTESLSSFRDLSAMTPDEMKRLLRKYCNDHPLADFLDAVVELAKTLPERQK